MADKVSIVNQEITCAPTTGFPTTARWQLIDSELLDTVNNPVNDVHSAYAPNDRKGLGLARKYEYKENWSRNICNHYWTRMVLLSAWKCYLLQN